MNIRWYKFKTIIRSIKWRYYGHALRMNDTKVAKQMTKWNTAGKRKRGRPKEAISKKIERKSKVIGLQCRQSHADAAADRNSWKKMVSTLCISLNAGGQ